MRLGRQNVKMTMNLQAIYIFEIHNIKLGYKKKP